MKKLSLAMLFVSLALAVIGLVKGVTTYSSTYTQEFIATDACSCEQSWPFYASNDSIIVTYTIDPDTNRVFDGVGGVGNSWIDDEKNTCVSERARDAAWDAASSWLIWAGFVLFLLGMLWEMWIYHTPQPAADRTVCRDPDCGCAEHADEWSEVSSEWFSGICRDPFCICPDAQHGKHTTWNPEE